MRLGLGALDGRSVWKPDPSTVFADIAVLRRAVQHVRLQVCYMLMEREYVLHRLGGPSMVIQSTDRCLLYTSSEPTHQSSVNRTDHHHSIPLILLLYPAAVVQPAVPALQRDPGGGPATLAQGAGPHAVLRAREAPRPAGPGECHG